MQKMNIVYKRLDELRPYENNAKTHPESQLANIAYSIENYGWKCTIAARTCLNVINPAQINTLECADIFKSAYMYAPVFGYCAPRAPRFFERETHGSEIDKKYDMDHLPALRSKAPPDKGGCSMSRCGYNL